jgi:hypothetical protein
VGGAWQRAGDTVSPRTAVNTFLCRASQITHDKELCRALPYPKAHDKVLCQVKIDQNVHVKGCVMRILVFVVRRRRTAKRVNPVVSYFYPPFGRLIGAPTRHDPINHGPSPTLISTINIT